MQLPLSAVVALAVFAFELLAAAAYVTAVGAAVVVSTDDCMFQGR